MLLPRRGDAVVDRDKLWDYLLSPSHPFGQHKAAFFGSLGFSRAHCAQLESALRWHAAQQVAQVADSPYGRKFVIRASLTGPSGSSAMVVSVWIIRHGDETPRFVTAYPGTPT